MTMEDKIIDYIKRNRVTTTEIADCLGKSGALEEVYAVNKGFFKVGKIRWTYASYESNWQVHKDVANTKMGEIVLIETFECGNRAIIGELVSKYILLYCQATAIVVTAPMRDAGAIIRENYPVWSRGVSPVGCFNTRPQKEVPKEWIQKHREMYEGAVAVCDDCGVVVIPTRLLTEEFYEKLVKIEEQEDIWFDCLDRRNENTFEIVCQKKYLERVKHE